MTPALPTAQSVRDALHCAEEEFSTRAMLAVMGRPPALAETIRIHEDRARGVSRAAVLRSLLRTAAAEGKPAAQDWTLALPRRVDVTSLLAQALPVDDFIRRAYEVILGRPAGSEELRQQRRALRWPRTRSDFLAALAASPEAERSGDIVVTGLGRRGASLRRFIAAFRGSTDSTRADIRHEVEAALSPVRELLHAHSEQLANVARQLAPLNSVATHAQSMAAAIERMRTRSEVEGAKTAEIAADTRSLHETFREATDRLVDIGRVVALLGERSQAAHDALASLPAIAAVSHELLGSTRMLADIPAQLRESTAAIAKLHETGDETTGTVRDLLQTTSSVVEAAEELRAAAAAASALHAAVSDMNVTVQNIDRRVLPPVVPAGETVVTQVDGFLLGVPAREWRLSTYYHTRGPLEPGVYSLFQKVIRPGMTVADVGANVGLYTLLAARLLQSQGRVFSFEPTPAIFHLLRENVRLNGFAEAGSVHLYDFAVSDREGEAVLYSDRLDSTHNSLFPNASQTEHIRVRTARLDDVLGPDISLDFIKIDAEGSEPLVLRGMDRLIRSNRGVKIVMEFAPAHIHRAERKPADVIDEILSAGFAIQAIDPLTGDLAPAEREWLVSRENTDIFLTRQ